ncbi:exonuclease SbcCD subunit D [Candidatus Woesearchaeota archaeon]|nr:exonuclease SbcCD subunit D [Candidatus Woesearchaeota archaeon]
MVKFAHLADCHIGSWRDPNLTELNFQSFSFAIDTCILRKVDFILIAGDLFNTSMPSLDYVNKTVKEFVRLKSHGIKVFVIAGSHDYSPSGKTMLKVFESAGLLINVLKGEIIDDKLSLDLIDIPEFNLQITGILGKKGTLEKYYYDAIDYDSLSLKLKKYFFKIFMFHSALTELKPKELDDMSSSPVSVLPKGFDYYAGGHVHYRFYDVVSDLGLVVYPGPTFPNNFKELFDLGSGSFRIIDYSEGKFNSEEILIELKKVISLVINAKGKTSVEIKKEIFSKVSGIKDSIFLLKIFGTMIGNVGEIDFRDILDYLHSKEPFVVLKNTFLLKSEDEKIARIAMSDIDDIEQKIINENFEDSSYVNLLISILSSEKEEGETNISFEERILSDISSALLKPKSI